jgi:hypothetical protein
MGTVFFECIQCGNPFELSEAEKRRCAVNGFDPPLRCPDCRRHKNKSATGYRKHPNRKRDYRLKYGRDAVVYV